VSQKYSPVDKLENMIIEEKSDGILGEMGSHLPVTQIG